MKISKEARRATRKLFHSCLVNGQMDDARIRNLVSVVAEKKPRHYLEILSELERLVRTEIQKKTLTLETTVPVNDSQLNEIRSRVQVRFPTPLIMQHRMNPTLIGGLRIKVGSDVWDGSVATKLQRIRNGATPSHNGQHS